MSILVTIIGMILMVILGFVFGTMTAVAGHRKRIIGDKYFVYNGQWYVVEKARIKEFMEKEKG